MVGIPRRKYFGKRGDRPTADESEHYIRCKECGWIDMRDLGAVFDHEGPLPHPASDQPQ
jgi:hypothetical protein